jgi:hypothetical protein
MCESVENKERPHFTVWDGINWDQEGHKRIKIQKKKKM